MLYWPEFWTEEQRYWQFLLHHPGVYREVYGYALPPRRKHFIIDTRNMTPPWLMGRVQFSTPQDLRFAVVAPTIS